MRALLASIPVAVPVVAMLVGVRASRAAVAGLAAALVLLATSFSTSWPDLRSGVGDGLPTIVEVSLILLGGITLSRILDRAGAQTRLAEWLESGASSSTAAILLVVHGVTPFVESVTGYGVGAMIAVPLLLHLGLTPIRAAVVGLLGLLAVPWGSMGPGLLVASDLAGISDHTLSTATAVWSLLPFVACGVAAIVASGVVRRSAKVWGAACLSGIGLWLGVLGASALLGSTLAGAVGALLSATAHLVWARVTGTPMTLSDRLRRDLVPYAVLLGGVLASTLLLRATGHDDGPWEYLASPALWLVVTSAAGIRLLGLSRGTAREAARDALGRWQLVVVPTVAYLLLGTLMVAGQMTVPLADAAAGLGHGFVALAPALGAVGGFITGSNVGAAALLASPTAAATGTLSLAPSQVLATQAVAASLLTMASPARVALAVQMCPPHDRPEMSTVMRRLVLIDIAIVAVLALGALVLL